MPTLSAREDYCRTFDLTCTVPPRVIEDSLMSGLLHLEEQIFNEENVLESLIRFIEGVGKSRDTQGYFRDHSVLMF